MSENAFERAARIDPEFAVVTSGQVGPKLWASIHTLARGVNSAKKSAAFRKWLQALAPVFPCPVCAGHWARIAPTFNATTPASAVKWTVDVHNSVNARLHKPQLSDAAALAAIMGSSSGGGSMSSSMSGVPSVPAPPHTACAQWRRLDTGLLCAALLLIVAVCVLGVLLARKRRRQ